MSRQTTTTCYALLSVLLVASLALVVTPANTKNGMANTTPDDNNVFMRKLMEENDEIIFSRSYISVTQADDFVTLFPNGGDTGDFLDDFQTGTRKAIPKFAIQGSSTTQKGTYKKCIVYNFIVVNNNRVIVCVCVCVCVCCLLYTVSCLFSCY